MTYILHKIKTLRRLILRPTFSNHGFKALCLEGLANIVYWVFHAIELTDEYRDDCCTDTVDDEAFTREVLARADKGGAITNGHDHVDMPIRLLCFGEGWWLGWLQNHVGFIEENGLVHGVQHGERAWPRLAPGRLLGMGLVFLKFFLSFGRGDKWRDQHLGAHRLPNDKVILAEVVEPFYRCALSDVIGHSLAFLGPGGALFSTGCTVRTFREVMLVAKNQHTRIIELDVNFDRLFLTSPHHMPKFRVNRFGSCQALALRALVKGVHALEGVFLLNLHGLLKALLKMAE
ncbi:unnamed protein product [Prunus armeniaca]